MEHQNLLDNSRVVKKFGTRNVKALNLPQKFLRYFKDGVHTLVEARWRFLFLFIAFSYFTSWTFFAAFYWIIALSHGDLRFNETTGERIVEVPCIIGAKTFSGFFLLSVEAQVSTG